MDGRRARAVLGVDRDAGPDEIRRAYRARAHSTHPDHGGNAAAFAEVVEARAELREIARTPTRPLAFALRAPGPRVDVYDSARRPAPRRDFADVLRAATIRVG
jgi:hypothetical protein